MADRISFALYDASNAPLTGVVPTFVQYKDRSGNARTQPTIVEIGGGQYGFTPTEADESTGVAFLIDGTAAASPRRYSGAVSTAAAPFLAWHLEDSAGDLWSGAAPTVAVWKDFAGADRAAPAVVAITTSLFSVTPSASDLSVDVAFRIDSPAGAYDEFFAGSLERPSGPTASASPGAGPEQLAVDALLAYWRRYLPAKVAALNALRPSVLRSALAEPFTVASGALLKLSAASQEATPVSVTLPVGSVTAQAIADAINAVPVPNLTASADAGQVVLTSDVAPSDGTPSVVVVARDVGITGGNTALGWSEGGEHVETRALVSPNWRGVVDGRAMTAPDMGQGFWVLLGNRTCRPTHPGPRRNTFNVAFAVEVWRPFSAHAPPHRSREGIASCVRAVREVLLTADGRYLGRQSAGDVSNVEVGESVIAGDPIPLQEVPGVLFDWAKFTITVRVFQRP